jgi:O-antigen/teichoic acid export membrane protein
MANKNILSSTIIYTIGDFITLGISGFLLVPLYVRYMSPSDYGIYSLVNTTISILGVLMMMGLHSAIGRYYFIYKDSHNQNSYLSSIWLYQSLISFLMAIVLIVFGKSIWLWLFPEIPLSPYFRIVIFGALLAFSSGVYSIWLRVQQRPLPFVYLKIVQSSLSIILILIFLVYLHRGVVGALYANLIGAGIIVIISIAKLGPILDRNFKWEYIVDSISFGGWMMLGTLGSFALNRSQLFILQKYEDLASVGFLFLGLQITSLITLLSVSFSKAWQPVVFSTNTIGETRKLISSTFTYYLGIMILPVLVLFIFPKEFILVVAGPSYQTVASYLPYLAIASFINVLGVVPATVLLHKKKASISVIIMLIASLINIILNLLLIPLLSVYGAIVSIIISSTLNIYSSNYYAQKIMRVEYEVQSILKISGLALLVLLFSFISKEFDSYMYSLAYRIALLMSFPVGLVSMNIIGRKQLIALFKKKSTIRS